MTAPRRWQSRELLVGGLCALAAFMSALSWALVNPPFQAPDEPSHFAYVQRLAETGTPPSPSETRRPAWSSEQAAALRAIEFPKVRSNPFGKPPWTVDDQALADRELSGGLPQDDGGGADASSTYPPLFYSVQAAPYLALDAAGANVLERLALMRAVSALMTALTVFFIFLFLRELMPGTALAAPANAATEVMAALRSLSHRRRRTTTRPNAAPGRSPSSVGFVAHPATTTRAIAAASVGRRPRRNDRASSQKRRAARSIIRTSLLTLPPMNPT
ncbi:MAG: DUF2142 domain-containing protein [bacterium]